MDSMALRNLCDFVLLWVWNSSEMTILLALQVVPKLGLWLCQRFRLNQSVTSNVLEDSLNLKNFEQLLVISCHTIKSVLAQGLTFYCPLALHRWALPYFCSLFNAGTSDACPTVIETLVNRTARFLVALSHYPQVWNCCCHYCAAGFQETLQLFRVVSYP